VLDRFDFGDFEVVWQREPFPLLRLEPCLEAAGLVLFEFLDKLVQVVSDVFEQDLFPFSMAELGAN
jgi:hypothetical protein